MEIDAGRQIVDRAKQAIADGHELSLYVEGLPILRGPKNISSVGNAVRIDIDDEDEYLVRREALIGCRVAKPFDMGGIG